MALIEILDISVHPMDADTLIANLDLPVPGSTSDLYHLTVGGWVLGRGSRAVAIEVCDHQQMIRTLPIDIPRPDVRKVHHAISNELISGFYESVGLVGSPLQFELTLHAVLEDERRLPFATIRGRRQPLRSDFEPSLQPLLITSLGRSGSTWLMRLLTEHARIVTLRQHPYEFRVAQYWLHMLRVVSKPADHVRSEQRRPQHWSPYFVGHNPYFQRELHQHPVPYNWVGQAYVEDLAAFCLRSIEGWYTQVARGQDQIEALYFAEKQRPLAGVPLALEVYPHPREIILVRDFRDVACSWMAFAKKRGNTINMNEEVVHNFGDNARLLLQSWTSREGRSHLVRYEDLVLRPVETTVSMLEYLGLEASLPVIEGMVERASADTPDLQRHRTSQSPQLSVGRWRNDLDSTMQSLCQQAFGEVLHEFGYRE